MYEYENADLRLQQDCNQVICNLERSISRIKAACVIPDTEKAITTFSRELATIIAGCAVILGADTHNEKAF